jgi:SAM-dependent methyltransferase
MKHAALLPLLYDAQATGGWTAGMVQVTLAMLESVPIRPGAVVLEIGCGLGAVARALQAQWPAAQVTAMDLHPLALGGAQAMAQGSHRPHFVQGNLMHLPFATECADLLLALDSFDQRGVDLTVALRAAHSALRPGGLLLLRVSAHPRLQGAHDVAFNTGRRYARIELQDTLDSVGYAIERISYANTLLAAPVAALRSLDRWRANDTALTESTTSVYASPLANRAVHTALILEAQWLRRANLPVGLSLLVLARKQRLVMDD